MNSGETIRFQWTLNRGDHLDLMRASMPAVRFAPFYAAGLVLIGVVLAVLGEWVPAVFGFVPGVLIAVLPHWQARRSEREYPLAGKEIRADADDRRLRMDIGAEAHSELRWDSVRGWSDTGRTIVLRAGTTGGYPIPRRAFADDEHAAAFTDLLRTRVGAPGTR